MVFFRVRPCLSPGVAGLPALKVPAHDSFQRSLDPNDPEKSFGVVWFGHRKALFSAPTYSPLLT